ncbi:MAG TPA: replicative DNA helicase [Streptosporangiaceae bacterium]|nr:replicative DNA helicase [Streptosporangiaceae bacterium]
MSHAREEFARTLPGDVAAEQCVLGGMMLSADVIDDVTREISGGDYYRPAHQIIHEAILELYTTGHPTTDPVAVAALISKHGDLGKIGGADYLHTLIASVPLAANAGYYARIVREKATCRKLIEVGTRITQSGYAGDADADELIGRAQAEVDGLSAARDGKHRNFQTLLSDVICGLEKEPPGRIETPWRDLDQELRIAPDSFTVIGARPGVGKSVLGAQMAAHAAIRLGQPAVIFSLEMSEEDLMLRVLSSEARVPLDRLTHRQLTDDDWQRIARTKGWIQDAPLTIIDDAGTSLASIRSCLRSMRRAAPALVVLDYLQLMRTAGRSENRQVEVAANSRGCKLIGREFKTAVVAMVQVNRGPEQRADKRPLLADLRESGAIEADADNVLLLHREDLYDKTSPRLGEVDVIIAKQRNGPTGTVALAFQGHYSRAVDMARPKR